MRDDLNERLGIMSTEVQNAVRLPQAIDIRVRGDHLRGRRAAAAAALSVSAVAVAVPVVLNVGNSDNGRETDVRPATGPISTPVIPPPAAPSPEPSHGWDRTAQEYDEAFNDFMHECLAEDGFEWTGDRKIPSRSQADFAAEFGFSISINLQGLPSSDSSRDPIQEYREQLPAEKRASYTQSIERCWNEVPENVEPPTQPTDRAVVVPSGGEGAFRIDLPSTLPDHSGTGDVAEGVETTVSVMVQSDPRIVAATSSWSGCMSRAGYASESQDDLQAQIGEMAKPYIDAYQAQLPPDERFPYDGPKSVSVEEALTDEQLAGLEAVQAYERAAAVASASCDDELNVWLPVVWQDKLDEYFGYTG